MSRRASPEAIVSALDLLGRGRTVRDVAEETGFAQRTIREWRKKAKPVIPTSHWQPPSNDEPEKIRISVSNRPNPGGRKLRGVAVGDLHDSPHIADKSRFYRIGRYIEEKKPDFVIKIGDVLSLDSLCRYDDNASLAGKSKPSFEQDIASGHKALNAYDEGKRGYEPSIEHITLGNHEDRAISFTNRTPEVAGILTGQLANLFTSHGFSFSPYGQVYHIDEVGFVHVPLNRLGKPYGGKTAKNTIANDAICDIVYGHDHLGGQVVAPKIGTNESITVLNLGCALPDGHVEKYVGHGMSGWQYGIYDLLIDRGRLHSAKHISMRELDEWYA